MDSTQSILLRLYVRQALFSSVSSILACSLFVATTPQAPHLDTLFMVTYISIAIAGVFAALSLTLFLNVSDTIRNRILLSGIVWIAPSTLLLAYVIYLVPELIGIISVTPYALGLLITFWRFRRKLKTESKLPLLEVVTKEDRNIPNGSSVDNSMWG